MATETDKEYLTIIGQFIADNWPRTDREAIAENTVKAAAAIAVSYGEQLNRSLEDYKTKISAMQGWYQTSILLEELSKIDIKIADKMAYAIWLAADTGDSYGELLFELAILNDVPAHPDTLGEHSPEEHKAQILAFYEENPRYPAQNEI